MHSTWTLIKYNFVRFVSFRFGYISCLTSMGLSFTFPQHISSNNSTQIEKLLNATHTLCYIELTTFEKNSVAIKLSWWHWHCHFETNERTNKKEWRRNERKFHSIETGCRLTWFDFQFIFKTILPWNFVRVPFQKVPYNYLRGTIKLAWLEHREHMFFCCSVCV